MASTTFKAVRESIASTIKSTTPTYKSHITFKEVEDTNLIEEEITTGKHRFFQVESGGMSLFQSVLATDLTRDSKKELIVAIIYPQLDNNKLIRDMADEDENLIVRTLQEPCNRPSGVLQITLNNTTHDVADGLRIVEYSFLVHYNHE